MAVGYSADFEVYGRVQGVFFRASTVEKANALGVVGWIMNTHYGTVKGMIQSEQHDALISMKVWMDGWPDVFLRIPRLVADCNSSTVCQCGIADVAIA
jgi:acylphosphatase